MGDTTGTTGIETGTTTIRGNSNSSKVNRETITKGLLERYKNQSVKFNELNSEQKTLLETLGKIREINEGLATRLPGKESIKMQRALADQNIEILEKIIKQQTTLTNLVKDQQADILGKYTYILKYYGNDYIAMNQLKDILKAVGVNKRGKSNGRENARKEAQGQKQGQKQGQRQGRPTD